MDSALLEEVDSFLADVPAFSGLPDNARHRAAREVEIAYFRRGAHITEAGKDNQFLSVIRSGGVELRLGGSELHARLGERDCFGYPSLIRRGPAQNEAIACEDTLLYRMRADTFHQMWDEHQQFRHFFDLDEAARLRRAVHLLRDESKAGVANENIGIQIPIGKIISGREVVQCEPTLSIGKAASLMAEKDVSVLPVLEDARLVGILTDKDLRRRVLAVQLDLLAPVSQIMTPDPITVSAAETVLVALVAMTTHNIRHLPVVDNHGALTGIISSSDVLSQLGANSFHLAREVQTSPNLQSLIAASGHLPRAVASLVEAGVDADPVARYVSSIGEAIHQRILALAERELGQAPVAYAMVGFGSLARQEMSLGSDQDNGFVFGEDYRADEHGEYFAELGRRLADGLDSAGYQYCPGDIMASNPEYRATIGQWTERFAKWTSTPEPQAILDSDIFFDIRPIAGEASLVEKLRADVYEAASQNRIFVSFLARAAAGAAVPLGFFRNFLLEKDALEGKVLDLKAQAINPIIDLARTHAVANNIIATGTVDRINAARKAGSLDEESARDLTACFEFVRDVRFRHQAVQIRRGDKPTNKLDPAELSRFDREHLRDAFKIIKGQLDRLRSNYAGGLS